MSDIDKRGKIIEELELQYMKLDENVARLESTKSFIDLNQQFRIRSNNSETNISSKYSTESQGKNSISNQFT